MGELRLRNVTFPDPGHHAAKLEFSTSNTGGAAQITVHVVLRAKDNPNALVGEYKTVVDDGDVVREGRRKLHEFATLLAEQTKDWAAPSH